MSSFIVDNTGTILNIDSCYVLEGDFDAELSDSELYELAKAEGVSVSDSLNLLDSIADALWGQDADQDWNADTLDAIADAIRTLRPDLAPD